MIRAKDAVVARVFQAQCRVCDWRGNVKNSYEAANRDRTIHLSVHRQREEEAGQ